jgi:FtsP/CotA-like multicopper oxidase with cupredoxin domain
MSYLNSKIQIAVIRFLAVVAAVLLLTAASALAAVPGIQGPAFSLTASANLITLPDGMNLYSWGYGCASSTPVIPSVFSATCLGMQVPGPTLIVTEGQTVNVTLTNNLPTGSGNTSILFPGFQVTATGGVAGLRTQEATASSPVTYTFIATTPGTHSYYSGTQPDLQIEMGLYGALIVLPQYPVLVGGTGGCTSNMALTTPNYSLSTSAYDRAPYGPGPSTCYDREFLFQLTTLDPRIHRQVAAGLALNPPTLNVATEPYHSQYYLINGRSFPDDMDSNFVNAYPHQPYNASPRMHPGDLVLLRIIGQGRLQHPFHEHANHVRILARDGNLLLSPTDMTKLSGPLLFTTTSTPGEAMDGIFYFTGRGLNWDMYNHPAADAKTVCYPDANGYYTAASPTSPAALPTFPGNATAGTYATGGTMNYYEWCADHKKPLESSASGPTTLPDPFILTNGAYYGGSAYLGPDALAASMGNTPFPPGSQVQNQYAGFAYMWHSHNERELTNGDVFPGGMLLMMIVDAPYIFIDETM